MVAQRPGSAVFAVVPVVDEQGVADWPTVSVPEKLPPLLYGIRSTTWPSCAGSLVATVGQRTGFPWKSKNILG